MPARVDWLFDVSLPAETEFGWSFRVLGGPEFGPFPSEASACSRRDAIWRAWYGAARARGGWLWRSTARRWVATLPIGVPVRWGQPFEREPCTRHLPL